MTWYNQSLMSKKCKTMIEFTGPGKRWTLFSYNYVFECSRYEHKNT